MPPLGVHKSGYERIDSRDMARVGKRCLTRVVGYANQGIAGSVGTANDM